MADEAPAGGTKPRGAVAAGQPADAARQGRSGGVEGTGTQDSRRGAPTPAASSSAQRRAPGDVCATTMTDGRVAQLVRARP